MSNSSNLRTNLNTAINTLENAANLMEQFVTGPASGEGSQIAFRGEMLPTVAKQIADVDDRSAFQRISREFANNFEQAPRKFFFDSVDKDNVDRTGTPITDSSNNVIRPSDRTTLDGTSQALMAFIIVTTKVDNLNGSTLIYIAQAKGGNNANNYWTRCEQWRGLTTNINVTTNANLPVIEIDTTDQTRLILRKSSSPATADYRYTMLLLGART